MSSTGRSPHTSEDDVVEREGFRRIGTVRGQAKFYLRKPGLAAESGLSVSTVEKQLREARTGSLLLGFKTAHHDKWNAAMMKALNKMTQLCGARMTDIAVRALMHLLKASLPGDVAIKPEPPKDDERRSGDFTLEQLIVSFEKGVGMGEK